MFISLALILLIGIILAEIFEKIKLPRLLGLILSGIILGPYVLNLIDNSIIGISSDIKQLALIVILVKAGLALDIKKLQKIGRPAILMSFIPALCEIFAIYLFAPLLLGVTPIEALVLGTVVAAVSPAVIVTKMVALIDKGYGEKKGIPQLIIASCSVDGIFIMVLFTAFLGLSQGKELSVYDFLQIPISIILGLLIGVIIGFVLKQIISIFHISDTLKSLVIMGIACFLVYFENILDGTITFSSLLSIIVMASILKLKKPTVADRLAVKFSKIWIIAEIMLFVLIGTEVNIQFAINSGVLTIVLILIGVFFRCCGVLICLIKTKFLFKERLFCALSYIPKATVQAAIGGIPLSLGLAYGQLALSLAVLSIIITAPLGAIVIDKTYKKLLCDDKILKNKMN